MTIIPPVQDGQFASLSGAYQPTNQPASQPGTPFMASFSRHCDGPKAYQRRSRPGDETDSGSLASISVLDLGVLSLYQIYIVCN